MFVKLSYERVFFKTDRKHETLQIFYEALTGLLISVLGEQTSQMTSGISAFTEKKGGGKKGRKFERTEID